MKQKKEHTHFEELLILSFYNELQGNEKSDLADHLQECGICKREQVALQSLHTTLKRNGKSVVTESLLQEARNELRSMFPRQQARKSLRDWLNDVFILFSVPAWRFALLGVLCLALGFGGGYLFLRPAQNTVEATAGAELSRTENIKITAANPTTGEVEVSFDAVRPVRMKAKIGDQRVLALMAKALTDDRNPGARLRAVSFIARQDDVFPSKNPVIKNALIVAATGDDNPGVRKEALLALGSFPFDPEIQSALLSVLTHDENAGLRIAAIDALQLTKYEMRLKDRNIQSTLRSCVINEKNSYVRQQAHLLLQEAVNL
jgi:hypothetical protein